MKILIISNLYPPQVIGGYERSIADFARILQHRGHSVLVLTSDTPEFFAEHTSPYPDPEVLRCLELAGKWNEGRGSWFASEECEQIFDRNRQKIASHIEQFQPDVALIGNVDFLHTIPTETVLSARIPTAHFVMNANPGYDRELAPYTPLHQYVTCSNWVMKFLQESGYPVETAQTVYPGAVVEEFYQSELPPRDRLRIAYASLVMPYKGADVLIEALAILQLSNIPYNATIAGDTLDANYVKTLKEFVITEGMDDRVQFVGVLSRQELSQLYKTHNVLVFPSRFQEPFGISQIEAMAAGLTLVTSGTGGAREIIEHGQDGLIFESENSLDLADQLSFLVAEPVQWEAMTRQGQEKALSQFSHTAAAQNLERIFQNLISLKLSLEKESVNLHIGGKQAHPEWKILDIQNRPEVDYVSNAADLSQFPDNSINKIYASHVLEHFCYELNDELTAVLKEWHRVLKPGGELLISVPDLKVLCWLYLHPNLGPSGHHQVMRIIYGSQTNSYDMHKVGFDFELLGHYLQESGFKKYWQVSEFNIFNDSSSIKLFDTLISLNVIARK